MSNNILSSESCCITTLRSLAMAMIVTCHIVLSYDSNYYAVLNIGVQIFFVISAFLYAQKDIDNPPDWLKRRFMKLYPPLFIFLICAFPILFAAYPELFSFKKVLLYFMNCQIFLRERTISRTGSFVVYDHYLHLLFNNSNLTTNKQLGCLCDIGNSHYNGGKLLCVKWQIRLALVIFFCILVIQAVKSGFIKGCSCNDNCSSIGSSAFDLGSYY